MRVGRELSWAATASSAGMNCPLFQRKFVWGENELDKRQINPTFNHMKKPPTATQEIAAAIGEYFLHFFEGDMVKTREYIAKLNILDIRADEHSVTIATPRPGIIIGKKGIHFYGLESALNKKLLIEETFSWNDYLMPYDPADYF